MTLFSYTPISHISLIPIYPFAPIPLYPLLKGQKYDYLTTNLTGIIIFGNHLIL
jgi:hypothetical protein